MGSQFWGEGLVLGAWGGSLRREGSSGLCQHHGWPGWGGHGSGAGGGPGPEMEPPCCAEKLDEMLAAAAEPTLRPDIADADSRAATVKQRPTSRRITPAEISVRATGGWEHWDGQAWGSVCPGPLPPEGCVHPIASLRDSWGCLCPLNDHSSAPAGFAFVAFGASAFRQSLSHA